MIDCISMWNPWAQWVALGWKTIETRRHARLEALIGFRIAIHAAQKWDPDWREKSKGFLSDERYYHTMKHFKNGWPRGALVCTVLVRRGRWIPDCQGELTDLNKAALCDVRGLHCLFLEDVHRFEPISWTGHQGIMKVPEEVISG
jgi:hypothetical protein